MYQQDNINPSLSLCPSLGVPVQKTTCFVFSSGSLFHIDQGNSKKYIKEFILVIRI